MSTLPVSDKSTILQDLQAFQQDRALGNFRKGRTTEGHAGHNPSVVVVINGSQGTSGPLPPESIHLSRQEFYQQRKADLQQLGDALKSGDTAAAQKAYDALVALGKNGPLANGDTFHRSDRAQDFAAIGQALASGDLAGATAAFDTLASTFQGHGRSIGPLPPTPAPGPVPPTPAPVGTLPPTPAPGPLPPTPAPVGTLPPSTNPPDATLPPSTSGAGGPSGPPEIIINVGGGSSTGHPGDIVVNLPQATTTPEEVQINFGNQQGQGSGQVNIGVQQQNGSEAVSINVNGGTSGYQIVLNLTESASNSAPQNGSVNLQA